MDNTAKTNFIKEKDRIRTRDGVCEILIGDALEILKDIPKDNGVQNLGSKNSINSLQRPHTFYP